MTRYLITGDPAHTIKPTKDTSIRMAAELLARGIEVEYCNLFDCNIDQTASDYLAKIPTQKILSVDPAAKDFMPLAATKFRAVTDFDVILHRKDPPVDNFFMASMKAFAAAPSEVLQINSPLEVIRHSEKELATLFPEYMTPTKICESFEQMVGAVRDFGAKSGEAVLKPFNESSGIGVEFHPVDVEEKILRKYWEARKPKVVVQPFLKEITQSGDLRILVINTKIIGAVLRVPAKGSRLGNFYQGATAAYFEPTPWQMDAAAVISKKLLHRGLYLLGLDFIGDHLSEINVTSPTCLAQINEVSGIYGEKILIDECESLRLKHSKG